MTIAPPMKDWCPACIREWWIMMTQGKQQRKSNGKARRNENGKLDHNSTAVVQCCCCRGCYGTVPPELYVEIAGVVPDTACIPVDAFTSYKYDSGSVNNSYCVPPIDQTTPCWFRKNITSDITIKTYTGTVCATPTGGVAGINVNVRYDINPINYTIENPGVVALFESQGNTRVKCSGTQVISNSYGAGGTPIDGSVFSAFASGGTMTISAPCPP